MAKYNYTLQHVPGQMNPTVDVLSKNTLTAIPLELITMPWQNPNGTILSTKHVGHPAHSSAEKMSPLTISTQSFSGPIPWIPGPMCRQVFDIIHGLSHPLRRSTAQLVKPKFIWQGITKDAKDWVHAFTSGKTLKIHRHADSGVGTFPKPQRCFAHIHVDVVVPLPTSQGHHYLITVINHSTCWPKALPNETAMSASLLGWKVRFGIPEHITSDRGTTFTSQL
ncbi:uncharacterized protein [Palaemon carinicauda]|uniref:uncharacterized protein n=1 Tax=Palaemon carinicauda TaxID=392227 RepID=UPI0035B680E1